MKTKTETLNEYLVTVFDRNVNRLGAFTLYGNSDYEVYNKWFDNKKENEYFATVDYKGTSEFQVVV